MEIVKYIYDLEQFKKHFLLQLPIIDVRAPIEFKSGSIPGSVNLPILNDEERHIIGTCYKQMGQEAAVKLGYEIVSGENKKAKVDLWKSYIEQNPKTLLTCFRGGKRSQITQIFLNEIGYTVPRISQGYKQIRQFFIEELQYYSFNSEMLLLTGNTGSAKTLLLNKIKNYYPAVDLEFLAQHRGSAFGAYKQPQPMQADFENKLTSAILNLKNNNEIRPFLFEDESRLIGQRHLPLEFFEKLRQSKVIQVVQTLAERIDHIYLDYIKNSDMDSELFDHYLNSLNRIEKRLGGLKTQEIKNDLLKSKNEFLAHQDLSSNKIWIEKLLVNYYDKMYESSLANRNPQVLFSGNHQEVLDFFKQLK